MCGMLHCEHESEKLMFWKESLSFELPDSSIFVDGARYNCKAAILDVGLDSDNPGLAPDGSKCGENMVTEICYNVHFISRVLCRPYSILLLIQQLFKRFKMILSIYVLKMCISQRCVSTAEILVQLNCPDCNGNGVRMMTTTVRI